MARIALGAFVVATNSCQLEFFQALELVPRAKPARQVFKNVRSTSGVMASSPAQHPGLKILVYVPYGQEYLHGLGFVELTDAEASLRGEQWVEQGFKDLRRRPFSTWIQVEPVAHDRNGRDTRFRSIRADQE